MELLHANGNIIAQRYRILKILGQGGVGTTYEAQDLQTNQQVALKALSLRRMTDWKQMELFEREARILSQLNHPAIPQYLDYFQVDAPQDRYFYIAQQLATGESLAELVNNGWQPNECEVWSLAIQILEILVYLQSLIPSVIHRDIKPQNLILQFPSTSPMQREGQVFLVDFGAVQDTYQYTVMGGSTVVGTYGYMAPEQFRGKAGLSTDLYGLGTTLLFLLTGTSPADLPQRKLKLNFRPYVRISQEFADWLERMLEPAPENRFHSAEAALAVLWGKQGLTAHSTQLFRQSKDSRIALIETQRRLIVEIQPCWLRSDRRRVFGFLTQVCKTILPLLLIGIVPLGLIQAIALPSLPNAIPYSSLPSSVFANTLLGWFFTFGKLFIQFGIFFLVFYVLIGFCRVSYFLFRATSRTWLEIDPENFRLQRWLLGVCYQKAQGHTADINQVKLSGIKLPLQKKSLTACLLRAKLRKYCFGAVLTQPEQEFLVGEVTTFLEKMRSLKISTAYQPSGSAKNISTP